MSVRSLLLMIYIIVRQAVILFEAVLSFSSHSCLLYCITLRTVSHSLILIIVSLDLCDTTIAFLDNAFVPMGKAIQ